MFFNFKKKNDKGLEKRKEPRVRFYQASYFLPVSQSEESGTFECWFNNISEGGLSFETNLSKMKEGDEVKVLYKIGTKYRNDNLKIQFASRSLDKYKYGCAFVDSDENRKMMIDEYFKMKSELFDLH